MAQLCKLLEQYILTQQEYDDITSLFLPYDPDLCRSIRRLPYSTARGLTRPHMDRNRRISQYLEYVRSQYLWLQKPRFQSIEILINRCQMGITPQQVSIIPYLIRERGNIGFSKEHTTSLVWQPNLQLERLRIACNARLVAENDIVTFIMIFTRRSIVPGKFWGNQGGLANSIFYVQYFITRGEQVIQRSIYIDGAWGLSTHSENPFYIGFGDTYGIKSVQENSLFPLYIWCIDPSTSVNVGIHVENDGAQPLQYFNDTVVIPFLNITKGQIRTDGFVANLAASRCFISRVYDDPLGYPKPTLWYVAQLDDGREIRGEGSYVLVGGKRISVTITIISTILSEKTGTVYPSSWEVRNADENLNIKFVALTNTFNRDLYGKEFFNSGAITTPSGLGYIGASNYVDETKVIRRMLRDLNFTNADDIQPLFYISGFAQFGYIFVTLLIISVILSVYLFWRVLR